MIKVLSIGNSFSQDAHRWLYDICREAGVEVLLANLYIGGCSLERHWTNIDCEEPTAYRYEIYAHSDRKIALKEGLAAEDWDIVTFQQASIYSGVRESYLRSQQKRSEGK